MQSNYSIRKFIRYPSDAPIKVSLDWVNDELQTANDQMLTSISHGGLSFRSFQPLLVGQKLKVNIPVLEAEASLMAAVVWCEKDDDRFKIGLELKGSNEDSHLRMLERACQIEHYRHEVKHKEGRDMSMEEAGREWISRYAGDFPAF